MSKNSQWKRIIRPATQAERERHAEIRTKAIQEFPPWTRQHFYRQTTVLARRYVPRERLRV